MAEDRRGRRGNPEESHYAEEDDRRSYQLPPPPSGSGVTLPSISSYGQPAPGGRYPPSSDPRASGTHSQSPTNSNGYATPGNQNMYQLPPVNTYDPRPPYGGDYYAGQQPRGPGSYPPPPDAYRGGYQPYPPHAPNGGPYDYNRGPGGQSPYDYNRGSQPPNGGPYDYTRVGPASQQPPQAAPRQRTSIACRYCRKRKIRCSGYQNTNNGKCTNCDKLRIECIFQPVASNSGAAFIPVSAVPGGVPPGTPLYGAYGQPLPPAGNQAAMPGYAPQAPGYPPPPNADYPPLASPTGPYPGHDERSDPGRRRPREDDHAIRLPPPNPYQDDDPRRRSPASNHSNGTPPTAYHQYPQGHGYDGERTPTPRSYDVERTANPRRNSPGSAQSSNPMSLDHLIGPDPRDGRSQRPDSGHDNDIDRNMLGRLNRRN